MKFFEREHFCSYCNKDVFFLEFTTYSFIRKKHYCPTCSNEVRSFWSQLSLKYIIPLILGTCFFANSAIYSFWIIIRYNVYPVDWGNIMLNLIIASYFAILGLKNKKNKLELKQASEKEDLIYLEDFRKQSLFIFMYIMIGLIFSFTLNYLIYIIVR